MMKNKLLNYLGTIFIGILLLGCQDLEQPGFSDFPYDGPVITLSSPMDSGVITSQEEMATVVIQFQIEDDLGIADVSVQIDNVEIVNISEFTNNRLLVVDDLTTEVSTGIHTLTITATDINDVVVMETAVFEKIDVPPYTPLFDGEQFYMAFEGDYLEAISGISATAVGNPGFTADAKVGTEAYEGAADSYLTFPTTGLLGAQFSASFWTKVNATPDRAGVLVIGPPDADNPDAQNNRTSGFRLFRENANGMQRYKLNVGNGTADSWFDGGAAADVDPTTNEWVHLAFTISESEVVVYINGEVVSQGSFSGIDWTGCDVLSIMSGAPRFSGWGHLSDSSYLDDLRLFNTALTQNEILAMVAQGDEIFKLGFNGNYTDRYSGEDCTEVGNPSFTGMAGAFEGSNAYLGATDSYLTFPTDGLLNEEFSAIFRYKVNAIPDRAGILVVGPQDTDNPDAQNNRTSGFRLFRENAGGMQRIKLNVGNGTGDNWFDGGAAADIDPNSSQWTQIAFTISGTEAVVYIDGQVVRQDAFAGVDWTDCNILSIMSGAPRFTGWGHLSDESAMDDLRIYKKALSQAEIQSML
ncbi:LamG domain-containing protein [Winogradskyella schleiferi]|uniref:LamG domain-containing protein n=1 Tax=Winogradskyella schleiferi TaxID=2686078 RepID=UPI001E40B50D|nr:LamG domain-containing protein [Winogradskyella schleiferi]